MINFYKEDGIAKISFADGQSTDVLGRVSIFVDNTVNQLVISEDGRDKFWVATGQEIRVNNIIITGTNQHKADLIAPVFALTASGGTPTNQLSASELQFLKDLKATTEQ